MTASGSTSSAQGDGHLRVTLLVTPSPKAGCAVLDAGARGRVTMHETLRPGETCEDCTCKAEATAADDPSPRLLEGNVTDHCVCPVFSEHDCLASVEGFEGETLTISVAVPTREELSAVIAALRERGATVRLKRLSSSEPAPGRRLLEIDAGAITDKQREAVRAAVAAGYYETPRDADLSDLAAELGVSRSAVSQRLTAVESKLVAELVRGDDGRIEPATTE
jgi:hypothetical protein